MNPETHAKLTERLRLFANRWRRTPLHGNLLSILDDLDNNPDPIPAAVWDIGQALKVISAQRECWSALPELASILRLLAKLK